MDNKGREEKRRTSSLLPVLVAARQSKNGSVFGVVAAGIGILITQFLRGHLMY